MSETDDTRGSDDESTGSEDESSGWEDASSGSEDNVRYYMEDGVDFPPDIVEFILLTNDWHHKRIYAMADQLQIYMKNEQKVEVTLDTCKKLITRLVDDKEWDSEPLIRIYDSEEKTSFGQLNEEYVEGNFSFRKERIDEISLKPSIDDVEWLNMTPDGSKALNKLLDKVRDERETCASDKNYMIDGHTVPKKRVHEILKEGFDEEKMKKLCENLRSALYKLVNAARLIAPKTIFSYDLVDFTVDQLSFDKFVENDDNIEDQREHMPPEMFEVFAKLFHKLRSAKMEGFVRIYDSEDNSPFGDLNQQYVENNFSFRKERVDEISLAPCDVVQWVNMTPDGQEAYNKLLEKVRIEREASADDKGTYTLDGCSFVKKRVHEILQKGFDEEKLSKLSDRTREALDKILKATGRQAPRTILCYNLGDFTVSKKSIDSFVKGGGRIEDQRQFMPPGRFEALQRLFHKLRPKRKASMDPRDDCIPAPAKRKRSCGDE